tara:strand:+ start:231 stop:479 length:249 start_codon:yes stop_codon:yes gene_type:complete
MSKNGLSSDIKNIRKTQGNKRVLSEIILCPHYNLGDCLDFFGIIDTRKRELQYSNKCNGKFYGCDHYWTLIRNGTGKVKNGS